MLEWGPASPRNPSLSRFPGLELQACVFTAGFLQGAEDSNAGPHARTASPSPPEPSLQPLKCVVLSSVSGRRQAITKWLLLLWLSPLLLTFVGRE